MSIMHRITRGSTILISTPDDTTIIDGLIDCQGTQDIIKIAKKAIILDGIMLGLVESSKVLTQLTEEAKKNGINDEVLNGKLELINGTLRIIGVEMEKIENE